MVPRRRSTRGRYLGALIVGVTSGSSKEELLSKRYSPVGSGYWKDRPLAPTRTVTYRGH